MREKINSMLFERTVISKHPKKVIESELKKLEKSKQYFSYVKTICEKPHILNLRL